MTKQKIVPEKMLEIVSELKKIQDLCDEYLQEANAAASVRQEEMKADVIKRKKEFQEFLSKILGDFSLSDKRKRDLNQAFLETLISATYDFDKRATKQDFGAVEHPLDLPRDMVAKTMLNFLEEKNQVLSANPTSRARLKENGNLVFCKNTHPDVAQLEIVAAKYYQYSLDGRTARGKVITDDKKITGMYVEAIPGFVSMRQLTDLANNRNGYQKVNEKISEFDEEIEELEVKIKSSSKDELIQLGAQLQEKKNFRGTYISIKKLQLINAKKGEVEVGKISNIIARALCCSFFCEDWDRHKDNFGVSFKDGSLGVASLDYDKSLSGIFGQDNKCYDWKITPKRLKNFPEFDCWYWPTSSNRIRKLFNWLIGHGIKTPKMYSSNESRQYSELKNNHQFQRQSQIEWLKLILIPERLRQLAVDDLASPSCDKRLKQTPETLEGRRIELLDSLVQINDFRDMFVAEKGGLVPKPVASSPKMLSSAMKELHENMSPEEYDIVLRNKLAIEKEILAKVAAVKHLEQVTREFGSKQLLAVIEKTGISYSPNITKDHLEAVLESIDFSESPFSLSSRLNKELGLDISLSDVNIIKQELYLGEIAKNFPEAAKKLKASFKGNDLVKSKGLIFSGKKAVKNMLKFQEAMGKYVMADEAKLQKARREVVKSFRKLGIDAKVIPDSDLKLLLAEQKKVGLDLLSKTQKKSLKDVSKPKKTRSTINLEA